ncbi:MAG: methyltransferase domain-containing protein [Polyangiaceae bacterium]|jgi:SAM-dependent methyltransferase|nr:methyltransferase domain-containing protein [Polyangiaceae bacterium]MBK8942173.1 methyltransferase domain-containing protein [Polyangiaceae bacterium]
MAPPSGSTFLTFAPEAIRRLCWAFPDDPQAAIDRAELSLGTVAWHDEVAVAQWVVANPFHGVVALALLADEPLSLAGARVRDVLPELWGLSVPTAVTTYEHEPSQAGGRATPLLDRVLRALVCAMHCVDGIEPAGRALATAVLAFCDVAKGGTAEQRSGWRVRLGVDGTVHNEDSAVILEDVVRRVLGKAELSDDGRFAERARVLCATSGLVGMRLRGEVGRDVFGPLLECIALEHDSGEKLAKVWSIVNHCETNAVRAGLWTPALAEAFAAEERSILLNTSKERVVRPSLAERIARMRGGALMTREPISEVDACLDRLHAGRAVLESRLIRCSVWYAEAALGALSLDACVRLLLHLSGSATTSGGVDATRPWHLDLLGVVSGLRDDRGEPRRYHVRLLETILEATNLDDLMGGKLVHGALLSFPTTKGGEQALAVRFSTHEEASALLTLLYTYERKATAEFHHTLKALCDLYDLRKDDFDRVHNEAAYLSSMNAARSDKARLLDFAKPGLIVEVGPGGGVVLDLLADRFPDSRVVGVDASLAVVEAHKAKKPSKPLFDVIHGDAFELPKLFEGQEITTVVFCSVLHEIFSYVPWGDPPARFRLEAVDAIVAAAYKALGKGGRILIRDGVAPPDEPRVLELCDPAWRAGLDLFQKSWEARKITFEPLGADRVRIGQRDMLEFLTTFTWGPDSFPYEIREERAILPRAELVSRLLEVCKKADPTRDPCEIAVPPDLATYLQPGYPKHLEGHARIFDASGEREVPMPDVTGVVVLEKR